MRKTPYIPPAMTPQSFDELVATAADHMDSEFTEAGLAYSAKVPGTFPWIVSRVLGLLAGLVVRWHVFLHECMFASTTKDLEQLKIIGSEDGTIYEDGQLATGFITIFSATEFVGGTLAAGKRIRDKLTGLEYYTTVPGIVGPSSSMNIAIVADGIGTEYLCSAHPGLVLGVPAGISPDCLITANASARDAEGIESYRTRIIDRRSNPPEGGADADWRSWARKLGAFAVDGVWIFDPESAYGTGLYVADEVAGVCFTKSALGSAQIPSAGDVEDMQEFLDAYEDVPVPAEALAFAPTGQPVAIAIRAKAAAGYEGSTAVLEGYMETALQDMVRERTQLANRPGITIENSWVTKALNGVGGIDSYAILSIGSGTGADNVVSTNAWSYVYFVLTITWVA